MQTIKSQKKKTAKTIKKNAWFDKECSDLKKHITNLGKKLRSQQGNQELRNELCRCKTNLKKLVKSKRKITQKNMFGKNGTMHFHRSKKLLEASS